MPFPYVLGTGYIPSIWWVELNGGFSSLTEELRLLEEEEVGDEVELITFGAIDDDVWPRNAESTS